VLVTNAKSGPWTIKEIIAQSKIAAHGMSYGTTGPNSSQHLAVELLKKVTGANLVHVPYRGSVPAVTDVLGGQIPLASVDLTSAHEHIKSGALTAIGVTSAKRAKSAPDIPTIAEGGVAGYEALIWNGVMAPTGTPRAVIDKLNAEIVRIIQQPDVRKQMLEAGSEPVGNTSEQMAAQIRSELDSFDAVVKQIKLVVD